MYLYPAYVTGWNAETSHPIEENEDEPICGQCSDMVEPAVAFATGWGSTAFQAQTSDSNGNTHTVVVRQIAE